MWPLEHVEVNMVQNFSASFLCHQTCDLVTFTPLSNCSCSRYATNCSRSKCCVVIIVVFGADKQSRAIAKQCANEIEVTHAIACTFRPRGAEQLPLCTQKTDMARKEFTIFSSVEDDAASAHLEAVDGRFRGL